MVITSPVTCTATIQAVVLSGLDPFSRTSPTWWEATRACDDWAGIGNSLLRNP